MALTSPVREPLTSAEILPDAPLRLICPVTLRLLKNEVPVEVTSPSSGPTNPAFAVMVLP